LYEKNTVNKPKYYEADSQNKNVTRMSHFTDKYITFWRASKTFVRPAMINLRRINTQWASCAPQTTLNFVVMEIPIVHMMAALNTILARKYLNTQKRMQFIIKARSVVIIHN
jgi:hypothetical protein